MRSSAFLTVALLAMPVVAQAAAAVGEQVPEFSFPQFLNGDGRQKLSDFFGQPVMIEFWGTHWGPCIGSSVPSAIRTDHELSGKGLVTILMERQGADEKALQSFLLNRFPDNDCFACVSGSVPTPDFKGIPHGALVGVDGKLIWDGSPLGESQKVEQLIEAELVKVKKGWGDSAEARKVRAALYGKSDLGAASALAAAMAEGEERSALQKEIARRYEGLTQSVKALQEQGRWACAEDAAKRLAKSVSAVVEWKEEAARILAEFGTDAGKAELAAEKKLAKVIKQLRDKKVEEAAKALPGVLKSIGNTKVGERAQRLLDALTAKAAD